MTKIGPTFGVSNDVSRGRGDLTCSLLSSTSDNIPTQETQCVLSQAIFPSRTRRFVGRPPDETYFGGGADVPGRLAVAKRAAQGARLDAN